MARPKKNVEPVDENVQEDTMVEDSAEEESDGKSDSAKAAKKVEKFLEKLGTKYGKHVIMTHHRRTLREGDIIPTGIVSLDWCLGVGGLVRGTVYEIYGDPDCGKTALMYHIIGVYQRLGLRPLFIDVEHKFNGEYAKIYGVDLDNVIVLVPDNAEEAFDMIEEAIQAGVADYIAVDSASAMVPRKVVEEERDMGESYAMYRAAVIGQRLNKLMPLVSSSRAVVMFSNHVTTSMDPNAKYKEQATKSGKGLKYFSETRVEIRTHGWLKNKKEEAIGVITSYKVWRNKHAAPMRVSPKVYVHWGKGILVDRDLLMCGFKFGIIQKSGGENSRTFTAPDIGIDGKVVGADIMGQKVMADDNCMKLLKEKLYQYIEEHRTLSEEDAEVDWSALKKKKEDK